MENENEETLKWIYDRKQVKKNNGVFLKRQQSKHPGQTK